MNEGYHDPTSPTSPYAPLREKVRAEWRIQRKTGPTFRLKTNKIPKIVVSRLALRNFVMWFWFDGVDDVGELDSILDEEYRYVVADQVPVAFRCPLNM